MDATSTRLLPQMLAAPHTPARLYYMKGAQVTIELCAPRVRSRMLNLKMPQRLLNLYMPSLMATNLYKKRSTGTRVLRLKLPCMSAAIEIDMPALERMFNHMKGRMGCNEEWNTLPRMANIKECILTYRACEILQLPTGISNAHHTLMCMLDLTQLMADEVRDLWLAFRGSEIVMEAMARSIARSRTVRGLEDEEYIEWFLVTDEIPDEEREVMHQRIRRYLVPYVRHKNARWRRRRDASEVQRVVLKYLSVC